MLHLLDRRPDRLPPGLGYTGIAGRCMKIVAVGIAEARFVVMLPVNFPQRPGDASPSGLLGDINGRGVSPFAIQDNLAPGLCLNSAQTTSAAGNGIRKAARLAGVGNETVSRIKRELAAAA
jgi:hypothetical protein